MRTLEGVVTTEAITGHILLFIKLPTILAYEIPLIQLVEFYLDPEPIYLISPVLPSAIR